MMQLFFFFFTTTQDRGQCSRSYQLINVDQKLLKTAFLTANHPELVTTPCKEAIFFSTPELVKKYPN